MIKIDQINVIRMIEQRQLPIKITLFRCTLNSEQELEEYRQALKRVYELVYHTKIDIYFQYKIIYDTNPKRAGDSAENSQEAQPTSIGVVENIPESIS